MHTCSSSRLTNGIRSVWCPGCKDPYALAIELWNLHLGFEALIIWAPQILQICVAMEYIDDPAVAVTFQPVKTGMRYARSAN